MEESPNFALNAATLTVIGALIGSLAGAISFLYRANIAAFRELLAAKDQHIAALVEATKQVVEDRNYYRDMALRESRAGRRAAQRDDHDDENGPPPVRRVR